MSALYLLGLMVGLLGIGIIDWRYKLALFARSRLTLLTLGISVAIFLILDLIGIANGIFFSGHSRYMLNLYVLPEVPIEELFFLTLLCYQALVLYKGIQKWRHI